MRACTRLPTVGNYQARGASLQLFRGPLPETLHHESSQHPVRPLLFPMIGE